MELMIKLLTVFGLGTIELWASIPAGLSLQLHPVAVDIIADIGAMSGALIVILLGERVQNWVVRLLKPYVNV